ncbi:MAG: TonB-dependent siderophore receptor [Ideonella sp.]|nr:TonB-dependent siderophore receptor [Ideonella sp.]
MRTTPLQHNAITTAMLLGILATSSPTLAQTATPSGGDDQSTKLQTVTVSSERPSGFKARTVQVGAFRDQEMLDVPLTVNVIPAALLEAQDSRGVYDALRNTAGVTRAQLSGAIYDNLAIRGISLQNRTNYRLNGSLPIINLIDMPLENKERVEALKGASSMYYGFTTPVGVINLVTKRARPDPVTSLSLSGNEFGQFVQHLDLGRTFGDDKQFGARVNLVNGTLRNAAEGTTGKRSLATAALDWRINSSLSLAFDHEDIRKRITEPATIVIPAAVNGVITLPSLPDPRRLIAGTWPENDAKAKNTLLRADYTINDSWYALAEVGRAQTRRDKRDYSEITNYKLDTGEGRLDFLLTRDLDFVNRNARFELGGRVAALSVVHDLTFGVMENKLYQAGANSQPFSVPQNLYDPRPVAFIAKTSPTILNPVNTTDRGLYAMDRMSFGDFQFTVAVRSEDYETVTVRNTVNPPVTTRYTASPTTYSYSALYKLRKDTSLYASYIEGLEEGPIAPITAANAGAILPPAISKQTEIGLRTEALKGMMASLAYFKIERATSYTDANKFVVLDGRTEIKGFEASLAGELSRELSLYGSTMVFDPTLKRAATAALTGKTPDNTPKVTASLLLDYKPATLAGFNVNLGAYYTAKRFINPLNQAEIPEYTTFTAGLGYKTKVSGHPLSVQANVTNLGNKRYWETGGAGYLAVGAPRTVSFTSKLDF